MVAGGERRGGERGLPVQRRRCGSEGVRPSVKMTVPVGVPIGEVTVAVNVTAWPTLDGLADEATAVVVLEVQWRVFPAWSTTSNDHGGGSGGVGLDHGHPHLSRWCRAGTAEPRTQPLDHGDVDDLRQAPAAVVDGDVAERPRRREDGARRRGDIGKLGAGLVGADVAGTGPGEAALVGGRAGGAAGVDPGRAAEGHGPAGAAVGGQRAQVGVGVGDGACRRWCRRR